MAGMGGIGGHAVVAGFAIDFQEKNRVPQNGEMGSPWHNELTGDGKRNLIKVLK
jgi:hypothetical protein